MDAAPTLSRAWDHSWLLPATAAHREVPHFQELGPTKIIGRETRPVVLLLTMRARCWNCSGRVYKLVEVALSFRCGTKRSSLLASPSSGSDSLHENRFIGPAFFVAH